jgi:hypothetical protein
VTSEPLHLFPVEDIPERPPEAPPEWADLDAIAAGPTHGWEAQAKCRPENQTHRPRPVTPADYFMPPKRRGDGVVVAASDRGTPLGKGWCGVCPVRSDCIAQALADETQRRNGYWGSSPLDRTRIQTALDLRTRQEIAS